MGHFRLSALFLALVSSASFADITFDNTSTNTTFKLGGYLNSGYHFRRGDQTDWTNVYARQEAAENLASIVNSPVSSATDISAAKTAYQNALDSHPYWQNLNTSVSDIYFRFHVGAEQKISEDLKVIALYERDFRTQRTVDDDVTRRAFVGIDSRFGQIRFGRDESAMDYIRELLYLPVEKDGYEFHSLIQPISAIGRHDNSLIYNFNNGRFGFTAGAAFKTQKDFVSESSQSFSFKLVPLSGLTLAAGYVGGQLKTDTEGNIVQPDLTVHGWSSYDVSQVFNDAAYNPSYKLNQRQFNIGAAYTIGKLSVGSTVFKSKYSLIVQGESSTRASSRTDLDYDIRGVQASARYAITEKVNAAVLYSKSDNKTNSFSILDAKSVSLDYSLTPETTIYGSVGRNSSDASSANFGNVGLRVGF